MGRRRKESPDAVPRRHFASFRYDRHDAGSKVRSGHAALQPTLQSGLEAINEDARRADAGEPEGRRAKSSDDGMAALGA